MLRKIFAYVSIVGCLIAFAQCMKDSYKDVVGWKLRWEGPQPFDNPIPHLDVAKCITCSMHAEQAVYFLESNGKCWKFTQASEGGLEHVSIANVPNASGKPLFAFPAGPADAPMLHVGIVDQDQKQVKIQQCNGTAWEPAGSYQFDSEEATKLKGAACAIRNEEGDLNGLIVLAHDSDPKKSVVLLYSADKKKLKATDRWGYPSNVPPSAAVQIAPTKVLVARKDSSANRSIVRIEIEENGFFVLHEGDNPERLSLFLLQPELYFKKAVWALCVKKGDETALTFYTLEGANFEKKVEDLPEETEEEKKEEDDKGDNDNKSVEASKAAKEEKEKINHEKSLILPFSDAVYVVAKTNKEGFVYWKGSLQAPPEETQKDK
ncbi:MAG: hypothetical protein ROO73_01365 [Roseivirga sp.]